MTWGTRGPAVGARVALVVGRNRRLEATVDDRGSGWFDVDVEPGSQNVVGDDVRATLEFAGADGMGHVRGRLVRTPVPGMFRFTHTAPMTVERRPEFVRAHVAAPLVVRRIAPDAIARRAVTTDVTGGGMIVRGIPAAAPGQLYTFELELPGTPLVEGQFRVQQVEGEFATVVFTVISATDRALVVRYAADHRVHRGSVA